MVEPSYPYRMGHTGSQVKFTRVCYIYIIISFLYVFIKMLMLMYTQKKEDPGARKGRKVAEHCFSNDLLLWRVEK